MEKEPNTRRVDIARNLSSQVSFTKKVRETQGKSVRMSWRNINSGLRPVHLTEKKDLQYPNGFSEKDVEDLLRRSLAASYVPDIKKLVKVPLDPRAF
jgi:hypothetical protein